MITKSEQWQFTVHCITQYLTWWIQTWENIEDYEPVLINFAYSTNISGSTIKAVPMTITHQRILLHILCMLSCLRRWVLTRLLAPHWNVLEEVTAETTVRTLLSTAWRCFKARRACLLKWLPSGVSVCCRKGCRRLFADAFSASSSSSAVSLSLLSLPLTSTTPALSSNKCSSESQHYQMSANHYADASGVDKSSYFYWQQYANYSTYSHIRHKIWMYYGSVTVGHTASQMSQCTQQVTGSRLMQLHMQQWAQVYILPSSKYDHVISKIWLS